MKPGHKPPKPRWSIAELIDLEFLLQREGEEVTTEFFEGQVSSWVDSGKIDRPDQSTMSQALWLWLQMKREGRDDRKLPGRVVAAAQMLIGIILAAVMLLVGSGLVMGLLQYDGRHF